jgi:Ca-activated chloride channel homolog
MENFDQVRDAALEFFQASNPRDEFAVISFADQPRMLADFTDSLADIQPLLLPLQPGGNTALWDAVYLATAQMHNATRARKALLVISDGGDNRSRYTESEIKSILREADVQVYAIDLFNGYPKRPEEKAGLICLANSRRCQLRPASTE